MNSLHYVTGVNTAGAQRVACQKVCGQDNVFLIPEPREDSRPTLPDRERKYPNLVWLNPPWTLPPLEGRALRRLH